MVCRKILMHLTRHFFCFISIDAPQNFFILTERFCFASYIFMETFWSWSEQRLCTHNIFLSSITSQFSERIPSICWVCDGYIVMLYVRKVRKEKAVWLGQWFSAMLFFQGQGSDWYQMLVRSVKQLADYKFREQLSSVSVFQLFGILNQEIR